MAEKTKEKFIRVSEKAHKKLRVIAAQYDTTIPVAVDIVLDKAVPKLK